MPLRMEAAGLGCGLLQDDSELVCEVIELDLCSLVRMGLLWGYILLW